MVTEEGVRTGFKLLFSFNDNPYFANKVCLLPLLFPLVSFFPPSLQVTGLTKVPRPFCHSHCFPCVLCLCLMTSRASINSHQPSPLSQLQL